MSLAPKDIPAPNLQLTVRGSGVCSAVETPPVKHMHVEYRGQGWRCKRDDPLPSRDKEFGRAEGLFCGCPYNDRPCRMGIHGEKLLKAPALVSCAGRHGKSISHCKPLVGGQLGMRLKLTS